MKVLGVCIGAGVMVYPFRKSLIAGVEPRGDYQTPGNLQWKANFGDIPYVNNLNDFRGHTVDVIIGHPTCGHSSMLAYSRGKKLGNPKSDGTIDMFIQSVSLFRPKFFLFENLNALLNTYPTFTDSFPEYDLVIHRCSVAHFGNSQISRSRLIIVGIRKGLKGVSASDFKLPPLKLHKLKRVKELESALTYPSIALGHIREDNSLKVCMEKDFRKLTLAEIEKEWNSPKYAKRKKWDATTTGKGNMKNLPGVYRNLADEFPLTARKQNRQFNSKGQIMTPRELARIQGIPDEFTIVMDEKRLQYWLNKGRVNTTKCPPMEITWWFKQCLKNIRNEKHKNRKANRGELPGCA